MRNRDASMLAACTALIVGIFSLLATPASAQTLDRLVDAELTDLVGTYKEFHTHPELSGQEENTAALLAANLRRAGYAVTEHIGKYPDGTRAYGLAGILENGPGPRLLIRTELDALPIVEETGLTYASHATARNAAGQEVGVMHACGHDIHLAAMIGTARALAALRSKWHGTVMLIGQPAEEAIGGAKAMLADHLYERFGTPDLIIALHDTNTRAAGTIGLARGPALAGSTAIDVTLRGIGGHGAKPQESMDPIVMAGEFIVGLQTIVSRREDPRDPSVVTIGEIRGGTKRNIIPNEVRMELTARAFTDKASQIIVDGVRRTAQGVALTAGIPEELQPIVSVLDEETTPPVYNDPVLAGRVKAALGTALGAPNIFDEDPIMAAEDFGFFSLPGHKIPSVVFWLGAMDPQKFAAAQAARAVLPGPHTSRFEPSPVPTLRTGVIAMTSVAMALLKPR